MNVLIISDHIELLAFLPFVINKSKHDITVKSSEEIDGGFTMPHIPVDVVDFNDIDEYDVIWSIHCKNLFPKHVTESKKCINIHPGYNPYNRGHAPHVFSIINGKPCGVTVHRIDTTIDNGDIIYREEITVGEDDTSYSVYRRIIMLEMELLSKKFDDFTEWPEDRYIEDIGLDGKKFKGNINSRKDYAELCKLDMDSTGTLREHINLLRALTHEPYKNAYFIAETGEKIYVSIDFDNHID